MTNRIFGANPNVPAPPPSPPSTDDVLVRMLAAVDQLGAAVAELRSAPAPVIEVPPADLSEVVNAVVGLKGPSTAQEIAEALAIVLRREAPQVPDASDAMGEVVDTLKRLDFRLKGGGGNMMGTGGGSVEFSPKGLRQLSDALTDSDGASLTKNTVAASSVGANTIHTPGEGKAIRLYFFGYSAGSDVTGVLAQLRFGAHAAFDSEYLVAAGQPYARNIQAGKRFVDGGVDEELVLTLDAAQTVYVNYEIEEV